jgi:hypothetical protein
MTPRGIAYGLDLYASVFAARGDAAAAARLWGAADGVLAEAHRVGAALQYKTIRTSPGLTAV